MDGGRFHMVDGAYRFHCFLFHFAVLHLGVGAGDVGIGKITVDIIQRWNGPRK